MKCEQKKGREGDSEDGLGVRAVRSLCVWHLA